MLQLIVNIYFKMKFPFTITTKSFFLFSLSETRTLSNTQATFMFSVFRYCFLFVLFFPLLTMATDLNCSEYREY